MALHLMKPILRLVENLQKPFVEITTKLHVVISAYLSHVQMSRAIFLDPLHHFPVGIHYYSILVVQLLYIVAIFRVHYSLSSPYDSLSKNFFGSNFKDKS